MLLSTPDMETELVFRVCACVLSCFNRVTLCDPMECSLPGSSVHGILLILFKALQLLLSTQFTGEGMKAE